MTAVRPGMPKLNMPKAASPKAAIAANLGSASRSTGVSYGIFAQRTLTGSGIHLNNRIFNGASISATRHALNDNRMALFNNVGMPHHCNHNQGNTTMNKFMAGMMAMNMMAQMTAQTMKAINEAKAAKADDVKKGTGDDGAGELPSSIKAASTNSVKDIDTSISQKGAKAKTLADQCNTLDESTNALIKNKFTNGSLAAKGLQVANLNIDSIADINLQDVSLSDPPVLKDFDKAIKTIEENDKTLEGKSTSIDSNITTCNNKKGELNNKLKALRTNNDGNKNAGEIAKLEDQIHQLEAAIKALEAAKKEIETARETLKGQKNQMNTYKNEIKDLTNEKHDLVKSQMKDLNDLDQKRNDLKTEIDALRGQAYNQKDQGKLAKKIKEYNGMIDQMETLYTSLSSVGSNQVTNAEGKDPVDLSSLSSFANIADAKMDELPKAGSAQSDNKFSGNAEGQFKDGDVIELNGVTYKKVADGWIDERGNKIADTDAVLNGIINEQPAQPAFNTELTPSLGGGATSGLGLGANALKMPGLNMPELPGTITIGNKKYIPMGNDSYMCDGQIVPKDLVLRLQMAQFAPKTDEA